MSVTVKIKQKGLFKKKLDIKDIIKLTNLSYGISNENYCLNEFEIAEHTLLYDKNKLARGIDICIEGNDIILFLNLPTSKEEIMLFYDTIEKICHHLSINQYIREEELVNINDNKNFIKWDENGSIQGLVDLKAKIESEEYSNFQMFGIYNPITLGKREIKKINNDLDNLAKLLHELQSQDVYYASPHVYKINEKLIGFYAVGPNIPSVVPTEPYIVLNQIEGIEEWYVMIKEGKSIKYDDFIKNTGKTKYYDANHVIVNLSEKKINELLDNYSVEI